MLGASSKHSLMKLSGCRDRIPHIAPFSTFCDRFLTTASEMSLFEAVCGQNKEKNVNQEILGTPGTEDLPFHCVDHWQLVILKE